MGSKWSSLNAPGTEIPLCHSVLKLDEFPFSPLLALRGNKNWPPSMKVKKFKIFWNKMGWMGCKWSSLNAAGIEIYLFHPILELGESPSPLLALWGNKNWPPSMKVKKLKIFLNKMGSMGCKWSSLNAPSTENLFSQSILKLDDSPFPLLVLWGNKN